MKNELKKSTTPDMRVIGEIIDSATICMLKTHNHAVQITYSAGKEKFVSASATAFEVFDRARMQELWTPLMNAWFPQGIDTPELVLLRLELQDVEYWDAPSSPVTKVAGFFKAMVSDQPYKLGHHEKVNLHH